MRAHVDSRRAQILDGARRAFAQYGYDGATLTRLEEATGSDLDWTELARFANIVVNGLALRIVRGEETDVDVVVQLLEDAICPKPPA